MLSAAQSLHSMAPHELHSGASALCGISEANGFECPQRGHRRPSGCAPRLPRRCARLDELVDWEAPTQAPSPLSVTSTTTQSSAPSPATTSSSSSKVKSISFPPPPPLRVAASLSRSRVGPPPEGSRLSLDFRFRLDPSPALAVPFRPLAPSPHKVDAFAGAPARPAGCGAGGAGF